MTFNRPTYIQYTCAIILGGRVVSNLLSLRNTLIIFFRRFGIFIASRYNNRKGTLRFSLLPFYKSHRYLRRPRSTYGIRPGIFVIQFISKSITSTCNAIKGIDWVIVVSHIFRRFGPVAEPCGPLRVDPPAVCIHITDGSQLTYQKMESSALFKNERPNLKVSQS